MGFSLGFLSHPAPSETSECQTHHPSKHSNGSHLRQHFSHCSPPPLPAAASYTLSLLLTSAIAMVAVGSTTRHPPAEKDVVQISATSAFNICDGLFRMANCVISELPEAELRDIRKILDTLLAKVDRLLDHAEYDLSLNFDSLAIDRGITNRMSASPYSSHLFRRSPLSGRRRLWRVYSFDHHHRHGHISAPLPTSSSSKHRSNPRNDPSSYSGPNSSSSSRPGPDLDPYTWSIPPRPFLSRERRIPRLHSPPPVCSTGFVFYFTWTIQP